MKGRTRIRFVLAGVATLALSGTALGALLGVLVGFPATTFDYNRADPGAGTTYNASMEHFSVSAMPLAIRFSPTDFPRFVEPVGDVRALTIDIFIRADGMLIGGHPAEDLLIVGAVDIDGDTVIDYSGVLLTGEIAAYGSLDTGTSTDLFDFRFTTTGGLLAPFFAGKDIGLVLTVENSTFTGTFASGFAGGAKGVVGPTPRPTGVSGCTPGYWKQSRHFSRWTAPYTPTTSFESIFQRDVPGNPTLLDALNLRGGHLNALMRHTVAALLNAANPSVVPDPNLATPAQVIQAFQAAFDSQDYEPTKNQMEASNELGCPLN